MFQYNMDNENMDCERMEKGLTLSNLLFRFSQELDEQISILNLKRKDLYNLKKIKETDQYIALHLSEQNKELSSFKNQKLVEIPADITSEAKRIELNIEELENDQSMLSGKCSLLKEASKFLEEYCSIETSEMIKSIEKSKNNLGLRILQAQETERQRIARDLHDSTVQNLTSLIHKSELCIKLLDNDTIRTKLLLSTMNGTIKSIINDMRSIIYDLKPMSLDDLGLVLTVERFAQQIILEHEINVIVNTNTREKHVMPVVKLTLFRVIQEACNNAIKHANPSKIIIDLKYSKKEISVIIEDNGKGFDLEKKKSENKEQLSGFGLSIMKERVYLLSGDIKIQSERNKGTKIVVVVPLKENEGEHYE